MTREQPALLPVRLPRFFSGEETLHSPELAAGGPSLGLAFDQLFQEGGLLRCRLLVSVRLPLDHNSSFRKLAHAVVVLVRDGRDGRSKAFRLIDPNFNSAVDAVGPNFVDRRKGGPSDAFEKSWIDVPIEVVVEPASSHPGLLVHAALHGALSNVVTIPVGTGEPEGEAP